MQYKYFYGAQAEQFSFYRMPGVTEQEIAQAKQMNLYQYILQT